MLELFSITLGAISLLVAYVLYGLATRRGLVAPNRASWLIWSATTTTEALTYNALNQGAAQNIIFFISSIACIAMTISVWRHSKWERPTALESVCMATCVAALIIWVGFQNAFWAHVLVLIVIPISFLPTWVSLRLNPKSEQSPAWGLWTVSDVATLSFTLMSAHGHYTDVPYILIEFLCHASVWIMIGFATINPFRSFKLIDGRIMMTTVDQETGSLFLLGRNHLGKAVFAGQKFALGHQIVRFKGPIYKRHEVPSNIHDASDRFVQIGVDTFMGPSDGVDDLVNHSCEPNAGLRFSAAGPVLVALTDIKFGEELSWDYSTTVKDPNWSMDCQCRAPSCRGKINEFRTLSADLQCRYRDLNLVPSYLCKPS